MPSDIRNFFGGKVPEAASSPEKKPEKKTTSKRGRPRKVLEDSDDDAKPSPKKTTPRKTQAKKRGPSPDGEETTAADYFGAKKPKKTDSPRTSKPMKDSAVPKVEVTPKASTSKLAKSNGTPSTRGSERKRKLVNYDVGDGDDENDEDEEGEFKPTKLELDEDQDDIFTSEYKNGRRGDNGYEEDEDMKDVADLDDDEVKPRKGGAKAGRKRKSEAKQQEDEDEKPKKPKTPRKTKTKEAAVESTDMQAIFDEIPTVRPPSPPKENDGESKPKFNQFGGHANSGPAPAAGSKEIPTGAENCLAGLSFVFTGLLDSISREDGQTLVKRYGGRVVGAPSSKTSYVVLGGDAGPSKLKKIKDYNLKTINEDGLFELIRRMPAHGGDGKAGAEYKAKQEKEEAKVKEAAAEAEREEAKKTKQAKSKSTSQGAAGGARANEKAPASGPDTRLWTVKYAPSQLSQICGNKTLVEKVQRWLRNFPKNQTKGFKLAGADGTGTHRAVMIHGPPGIGKTTAAHLCAKLEGYDVVESNASDSRSKKLVEAGLKGVLSTTSLMGYFASDNQQVEASKRKLVLIMDEVDGMSAGDRGGVGALAAVCRKTQIPLILICNERKQPKMKPFDHVTFDFPFRRPTAEQIRARIMTIAYREKMKIPAQVVDALVEGSKADIRQVVNMVSQAKLDAEAEAEATGESKAQALDFDQSKAMSRAWEKNAALKPWDIVSKILGAGLFAPASGSSLNHKTELYFNDHDTAPLMLQENYLGTNPIRSSNYQGREQTLKRLELASCAADSISEGDLCERMIRGGEQHWSLMPVHAIFSFVRPASFVAGSQAGHQTQFTQYLGKLSSSGRLNRQAKEVQGHMRLRTHAEKDDIRMQYLPLLWSKLVKRLEVDGKDAVSDVIELMDQYYLTKEDWDSIAELGVDYMEQEKLHLETSTKAMFTRLYNQQSHPMPFIKASQVQAPKVPIARPDVEEAMEESEEEAVEDAGDSKAEGDEDQGTLEEQLGKDKYIKAPKAKKKGKAKSSEAGGEGEKTKAAKGKGKGKAKK